MDTSKTIDKWIMICSDNNRNCQVEELGVKDTEIAWQVEVPCRTAT
jgi:hypothetical protein